MSFNGEKKAVRVLIVNPEGSVILNQRPKWSKQKPNEWQPIGGGVKSEDVTAKDAAIRELREELGLIVEVEKLVVLGEFTDVDTGWVTHAFVLILNESYDKSEMPDHKEFDDLNDFREWQLRLMVVLSEIDNKWAIAAWEWMRDKFDLGKLEPRLAFSTGPNIIKSFLQRESKTKL